MNETIDMTGLIEKWHAIEIIMRHAEAFKDTTDLWLALDCLQATPEYKKEKKSEAEVDEFITSRKKLYDA